MKNPKWDRKSVVTCELCNQPMLPNVSTLDEDGCLWICPTPKCEYQISELEAEDLIAVGCPPWVAEMLTDLILHLDSSIDLVREFHQPTDAMCNECNDV